MAASWSAATMASRLRPRATSRRFPVCPTGFRPARLSEAVPLRKISCSRLLRMLRRRLPRTSSISSRAIMMSVRARVLMVSRLARTVSQSMSSLVMERIRATSRVRLSSTTWPRPMNSAMSQSSTGQSGMGTVIRLRRSMPSTTLTAVYSF